MILEVHVLSWTLHIALLRKLESITDQPEHCLKHKFKVNESNWKGRTLFKGMLHQQFIRNPFFSPSMLLAAYRIGCQQMMPPCEMVSDKGAENRNNKFPLKRRSVGIRSVHKH